MTDGHGRPSERTPPFPRWADPAFRGVLLLAFGGGLALLVLGPVLVRTSYATGTLLAPEQPIPFSHQHHAGDVGIDCRFCHAEADRSPFAGMPATKVCLNCHSQLFRDDPFLAHVFESARTEQPIRWRRVHDLPDFVFFDHSVHVNVGVACTTCHGRVDRMPLTRRVRGLTMRFCVDCHRDPWSRLVRPDDVTLPDAEPALPLEELSSAAREIASDGPRRARLADCGVCHR